MHNVFDHPLSQNIVCDCSPCPHVTFPWSSYAFFLCHSLPWKGLFFPPAQHKEMGGKKALVGFTTVFFFERLLFVVF